MSLLSWTLAIATFAANQWLIHSKHWSAFGFLFVINVANACYWASIKQWPWMALTIAFALQNAWAVYKWRKA